MATPEEARACNHVWVSNSGQGGEPEFRLNRHMSDKPLMHVRCSECGCRTWLTREQWDATPEDSGSS